MKNCSFDRMTKFFPAKINDTDKREHVFKNGTHAMKHQIIHNKNVFSKKKNLLIGRFAGVTFAIM